MQRLKTTIQKNGDVSFDTPPFFYISIIYNKSNYCRYCRYCSKIYIFFQHLYDNPLLVYCASEKTESDAFAAKSSKEEVYGQIIADVSEAINLGLPMATKAQNRASEALPYVNQLVMGVPIHHGTLTGMYRGAHN